MNTPMELATDCTTVDRELDRQFGKRGLNPSNEARRHFQECERCRRLYQWMTDEPVLTYGSLELHSKIRSRLQSSLKPVAPQASPRSLAARFWIVYLLLASPVISMLGIAGVRQMDWLQLAVITVILVVGGMVLSLSIAWQMTPGSLQLVTTKVAVPALAAGFVLGTALLFPWHAPEAFFAPGWHCFKTGIAMAVPVAFLFWLLARRGAPLSIGRLASTLGAIAGLFGASVLQFTCSRQEARHLLVWHGGVLVASILMGVVIAHTISRISGRQP